MSEKYNHEIDHINPQDITPPYLEQALLGLRLIKRNLRLIPEKVGKARLKHTLLFLDPETGQFLNQDDRYPPVCDDRSSTGPDRPILNSQRARFIPEQHIKD